MDRKPNRDMPAAARRGAVAGSPGRVDPLVSSSESCRNVRIAQRSTNFGNAVPEFASCQIVRPRRACLSLVPRPNCSGREFRFSLRFKPTRAVFAEVRPH